EEAASVGGPVIRSGTTPMRRGSTAARLLLWGALLASIHAVAVAQPPVSECEQDTYGVAGLFKAFNGTLTPTRVWTVWPIDDEYSVVTILAETPEADRPDHRLSPEEERNHNAFGHFIVDDAGRLILTLDIFATRPGEVFLDATDVSRATLTVRRFSDYGYSSGTTRYAFSLDPPMLHVRDFYVRHDVRQAVRIDDAVYFIVSDRSRSFILALSSVSRYADADAYSVIHEINGEPIPPGVHAERSGNDLAISTRTQFLLSDGVWTTRRETAREPGAPSQHIERMEDGKRRRFLAAPGAAAILEIGVEDTIRHTLPAVTPEELLRYRPAMTGYTQAAIEQHLGPVRVVWRGDDLPMRPCGDHVWFGIRFYEGEGVTGLGGFGYFDLAARQYTVFRPQAVADWSVSALSGRNVMWMGLVRHPEGAEQSGGLLRYDAKTAKTKIYPVTAVITGLHRIPAGIFALTHYGVDFVPQTGGTHLHVGLAQEASGAYRAEITRVPK
ncbi:MAG: hypothetical protein ABGY41_07970, partial [Candidatus Poribacteria bacterium]